MSNHSTTKSILKKALLRKKKKSESTFKYILFLLHLWLGLIVGGVICFIAITGALYVFKHEVEDLSVYSSIHREAPAESIVSIDVVQANFEASYDKTPHKITIPEKTNHNIRVQFTERGKAGITAFADRETGEIIGELSPSVPKFFNTIMFLHRWFNMENFKLGRQITAACTLVFMVLLISGLILWFPKTGKKNAWRNKFSFGFRYKFSVWNRDLHINMGMYAFIFLIVVAWTGIFFTYGWVKDITVNSLKPAELRQEASHGHNQKSQRKPSVGNQQKKKALEVNLDVLLAEANQHLNYTGDLSVMLSGKGISSPTIRKKNTHNLLGAQLYDDVKFSDKGKLMKVDLFKDRPLYQKVGSMIKPIHTGEILGLKSKIFAFILSLFAAYLPISGYIMWFKKLKGRSEKQSA